MEIGLVLGLLILAALVGEAIWLIRKARTARQGFGAALLGAVAFGLGYLTLLVLSENVSVSDYGVVASVFELVAYLLIVGGALAVLIGVVKAGIALVRTT